MHKARWQRFLPLLDEFGIRPILAVVPDNQDHRLRRAPEDPGFWEEMRAMEAAGASIAVHGYRHLCLKEGGSLIPLHRHSEFAGVAEEIQRQWIHAGLEILRGQGLHPRLWAAPRHGIDRRTLRALRAEGMEMISDGLARVPFRRGGLIWIPQQLWAPQRKNGGVWTICLHSNTASPASIDRLRAFLEENAERFTSVDRLIGKSAPARLEAAEALYERLQWTRLWCKQKVKHMQRRQKMGKLRAVDS